ncbi:serine--tRNA ligase [candidate division WOR-3 bacterium]|nr:serine--tRNA ligase [candidate division WOR-3 bacterium]
MLDMKFIRENFDLVKRAIEGKGESVDISKFEELDERRRKFIMERDKLRFEKKKLSPKIANLKRTDKDATKLIQESKLLDQRETDLQNELQSIESELRSIIIWIPNIPHSSVPQGKEGVIIRKWGKKRRFAFRPFTCYDLCNALGIQDFKRGSKLAGSNFPCYKGLGARLERALINFMLDLHIKQGYTEIFPPFLVNRRSMFGTAQLPKLEDDMYIIEEDDLFLNPTAEVPLVNLHQDEILDEDELSIKYVGYTACFRREAGSYGKETKGLRRVHQFNKVELIKFTKPENSYKELELMLEDAERVLKLLNLQYRVNLLSTTEMSFASAKTYDIEVWAPVTREWLEVSSVSNCEDFQARRAEIKFRRKGESEFAHILNGSGLATPRTFIAIIETYQQRNGTIQIPDALLPYMGGVKVIS